MANWWINAMAIVVISLFFTGFIIPRILVIAFRKRLFDAPDIRKIHTGIVPRLGGMAFVPGILFSLFLIIGINVVVENVAFIQELIPAITRLALGCCAIIVLYMVGVADDLIGVRYRAKFFFQIFCAILLAASGLWLNNLHGILGIYEIPVYVGYPLTIFIIVFVLNAINLIDGIDGLASAICGIALIFYGVLFMCMRQHLYALLAFAAIGTLLPFFYYNVFGNVNRGRKIFMGDTGALTIGFVLCFQSIALSDFENISISGRLNFNHLIVAFSPLIVPCFDVVRVFFYRLRHHRHPFLPDKNHIHHRLLQMGMSQHTALICIISFSTAMTLLNMWLSVIVNINILLAIDIVLYTILHSIVSMRIAHKHTPIIVPSIEKIIEK